MCAQNAILFTQESRRCLILRVVLISSVENMACHNVLVLLKNLLKNVLNGRFFILVYLLTGTTYSYSANQQAGLCVSTHYDQESQIDYVIDGDTVVLKDKRHIRLIGINTPEISHNIAPSEQGAETAKARLVKILAANTPVLLRYDLEREDRYGRTLAHLFLQDKTNIQALMLSEGLAMPLTIPPNLLFVNCYAVSSKKARNSKRGLWAMPHFQPINVNELSGDEKGFTVINGKVIRISESKTSLWINLENNFALRIIKNDLHYFNKISLFELKNKIIEAHGRIYKRKGQLRMQIRHPLDFSINY